ncbi:MAG: hypothetical protein NTX48_22100 [Planctomycetales bacterium]|nr:hypothetical protein [Planctomycetales bacterium]
MFAWLAPFSRPVFSAPEFALETYEDMGIDDEYFLAVPPDSRNANLDQIRKLLQELQQQ